MSNVYELSWLDYAITNHFKDKSKINSVNGDMTIDEYIKMFCNEELGESIRVD